MTYSFTDYAAWWGAIVATVVLGREIYKELSARPILLVRTSHIIFPENRLDIEIANIGTKNSTLTKVYVEAGLGLERGVDGRKIPIPLGGHRSSAGCEERFSLPHILAPGAVWRGSIDPRSIFQIDNLDTAVVKVRDERDHETAGAETSIPSMWRKAPPLNG